MAALGIDFEVLPSSAEEHFNGAPGEMVVSNAELKRDDVAAKFEAPALVIAADTLVFIDEGALGKPADLDEARAMLRRLSGRTHQVLTGLAVVDTTSGKTSAGYDTTDVTFRELTEDEIEVFVQTVKPTDRAGAYTVDGPGSLIVDGYNGSYQNVLGFPMVRLDELLRELGYSLFTLMNPDKAAFL
jgi:septum formation protein